MHWFSLHGFELTYDEQPPVGAVGVGAVGALTGAGVVGGASCSRLHTPPSHRQPAVCLHVLVLVIEEQSGPTVGLLVGLFVGDSVGLCVGAFVGFLVGAGVVGALVGDAVGDFVGAVGASVGLGVGALVGLCVGVFVGALVGLCVGVLVGDLVGLCVGAESLNTRTEATPGEELVSIDRTSMVTVSPLKSDIT